MRLREMTWRFIAPCVVAMVLAACGSGGYDLTCAGAEDCLESELCHPTDKVCVQLCTTQEHCPLKAEACEALSDPSGPKICKCPAGTACVSDRES
ncbi:hypothetical protein [Archangium violaceum]|uniref:Lipoprotein n=1 Tax=Archangium violaceum Cb vi76 TaxID=1406225 RepID=A0A084SPB2_9BACT|nr:hypothetical protein [Archangium violaceum]KFA90297.1 hypothetical protein Q664_29210 [Archangium violaceum Cb vi76]